MWEVNLCLFHHPLRHCAFWPVFVVMGYDGNAIQCFLILIGSRRVRGNAGRGRSQFHNGKEGTRPRQMCRQVVWSGTTRPDLFSSGLPTLFVSHTSPLLSFRLLLPLFYLMSFHLSQWKKTTKKKNTFSRPPYESWPKEKDDPDNGSEHIPAVRSDQLTLTSVCAWTRD